MTPRFIPVAAVAATPLVLAGVGLTHPASLNIDTAEWWTSMHLVLLLLFPLIAVAVWVLLRHDTNWLGWVGRVAAAAYAVLYNGLDAVAGVATGTIVIAGAEPDGEVVNALFAASTPLGLAGLAALAVALVVVLISRIRRGANLLLVLVSAVVLGASLYLFVTGHIYWPRGVLAMVGLSIGFTVLELVPRRNREKVALVQS